MEFLLEKLAREAVEEEKREREREQIANERAAQRRLEEVQARFRTLLTAILPEMVEQAYFTSKDNGYNSYNAYTAYSCAVLPAAQGIAVSLIWTNRTEITVQNEAYPALYEVVKWDERDNIGIAGRTIRRHLLVAIASVLDMVRKAETTREANRAAA